jgi:hypothetical protein
MFVFVSSPSSVSLHHGFFDGFFGFPSAVKKIKYYKLQIQSQSKGQPEPGINPL